MSTNYTILSWRNHLGGNYFHEAARVGSILLLKRARHFLEEDKSINKLLLEHDLEGNQPVHVAVRSQDGLFAAKIIELLVDVGADINGLDRKAGETPLHLAIYEHDYDLVKWLCKQPDIKIDMTNCAKNSPYEIAWAREDYDMTKILKNHGAETDVSYYSSDNDYSDSEDNDNDNERLRYDDKSV